MAKSQKILISKSISDAREILSSKNPSVAELTAVTTSLLDCVLILANRLNLNSSNSNKPPSSDLNKSKRSRTSNGKKRKPGAQSGHKGHHLKPVEEPTIIEELFIDRRTLPSGEWKSNGFEKRQVFDIEVSFQVTEYQSEILINSRGEEYVAEFPPGVDLPAQYGSSVKATSVYLSQYQLIPQERVRDLFSTQFDLNLSKGSVNNFNILAAQKLREWKFEDWLQRRLLSEPILHADETGSNINGVRHWIHCLCNGLYSYFHIDPKRGNEAMDRMGVLNKYSGTLVHDHWKSYFAYLCTHVLCNAHHLRELERAYEQDHQHWALKMKNLLLSIKKAVDKSGGKLSKAKTLRYQLKYRSILRIANKECPENSKERAQSKSRNLLERLIGFEDETLRFMYDEKIPFTNNQGERDLRMNKVQQKISGCFRSERGAKDFCLLRSYIMTARKQGVHPIEAIKSLFEGKRPKFMDDQ